MYYRLAKKLVLRGWNNLNAALMTRFGKLIKPLTNKEFALLSLCDGITPSENWLINQNDIDILNHFISEGMVIPHDETMPIENEQKYKLYNNRFFSDVLWSITGKCNYKCRHCYMNAPEAQLGELSFAEIKCIIDQLSDCGIIRINITGGEPFVRKDFWEIIDYMHGRGLYVCKIYTNGSMLNEGVIRKFIERKMKPDISISFDGLGWHDWMRGVSGAEQKAVNALKLCNEVGIATDVEMCLHRGNLLSIRDTVNYISSIGVNALKVGMVQNTPLWILHSDGNDIGIQEYYDAFIDYIPRFYEDGMPMLVQLGGAITMQQHSIKYRIIPEKARDEEGCLRQYLCSSARFNAYITPDGRFLPCMAITSSDAQYKFPLIKDVGMKQCMSDSYYMNFIGNHVRDLYARNKKCGECPYRVKCCGGCRAIAMLANDGDLYASDPEACFLFENGYPDKFRAAADAAIAKYCGGQSKA